MSVGSGLLYFKNKKDVKIVLLVFALFALDLLVFFKVDNISFLIIWTVLGLMPKSIIAAWNHHQQHNNIFSKAFPNRVLEVVFALQTGISPYTWVLHHNLGHHLNYLDQEKDESRWLDGNGKPYSTFLYVVMTSVTAYSRAFKVGVKRKVYLSNFVIYLLIVLLITGSLIYLRPLQGILLFVVPMVFVMFVTSYVTFDHHTGLDTEDEYAASRNITSKWYNKLTGNLGYHTAHHVKFGAHWSLLPAIHNEIKNKIPDNCYMEPSFWFRWLDYADAKLYKSS